MSDLSRSGRTENRSGSPHPLRLLAGAGALLALLAAPCLADEITLLDASKESGALWQDKFGDAPAGATLTFSGGEWIVSGSNTKDVWGRIHQSLDVDLTQVPMLEVDVKTLTRQGYLLVGCDKIADGYKRVADITEPGPVRVNLLEKTGLKGKQNIRFEIGVTDDGAGNNLNAKMSLTRMRLVGQASAAAGRNVLKRTLYSNADRDSALFNDRWGDVSSGATFSVLDNGNLAVTGTNKSDVWGCVYMPLPSALDMPAELVVSVENLLGEGYVILKHPSLPEGYTRLQPVLVKKGVYRYAVPDMKPGDPAELQVGVVNVQGPDATSAMMELSKLEIWGPGSDEAGAENADIKPQTVSLISPDNLDKQLEEFHDKWGDASCGASFAARDGAVVVTGTKTTDAWGCIYRNIEIPFNEDPVLNLDVRDVKGEGYIVLRAEGLPDGFVRLAPPPSKAGKFRYVLSDFVAKREKLPVELQIGVVNPAGPNAVGAELVISGLSLEVKKKGD